MSIKKYTDWSTWWDGLRTNLIKCIGTTGTSWLGSNALANSGVPIPGLDKLGLNWEQAIGLFAVHLGAEIFSYMKSYQPQVITETVDTTHFTKDGDGNITSGSSKKTTVTPLPDSSQSTKPTV